MKSTQWNPTLAAALVGAAVVLASAGCGLMAPKLESYVAPEAGATWTIARRDTGSYGSASVQLPGSYRLTTWQGRPVHRYDGPEGSTVAKTDDPVGFLAIVIPKGDTPIMSWDPPVPWQYPLEVGKSWSRNFKLNMHAAKQVLNVEGTWTVEAYEDVTVPAGTFKAWRVRTVDNLGNDNLAWYAPSTGIFVKQSLRRSAKHAAGAGTREIELVTYSSGK